MLNDIFETLGFKEEETNTYLALTEIGTQTAGDLAKHMKIPRPTLYGYLAELKKQGLVTESSRNGIKIFTALPPTILHRLYDLKIKRIQRQRQSIDEIIVQIEKRANATIFKPRMHFFEGSDGLENAFLDILNYPNTKTRTFWSIKSSLEASSEDFFWYHNKERIHKNIWIDGIWPFEQVIDIQRHPFMGSGSAFKREIRVAPKDLKSSMGYWIYADKVLFASSRNESFCFIIESAELVEMMSNQHTFIWDISTAIPVSPKEHTRPFLDDLHHQD